MVYLRYRPDGDLSSNTYSISALGKPDLWHVVAMIRTTETARTRFVDFVVTRHRRGSVRYPGSYLCSQSVDGSVFIVEPFSPHRDLPMMTIGLLDVPDGMY